MSADALRCFVCDRYLSNEFPMSDADNQPSGGTRFTSGGHYGSGVFDPVDDGGQVIEINVCDACLRDRVGREETVGWRREWLPVTCGGVVVGRWYTDRPLVPFTGVDEPGQEDAVEVHSPRDFGRPMRVTHAKHDRTAWFPGQYDRAYRAWARLSATEPARDFFWWNTPEDTTAEDDEFEYRASDDALDNQGETR